jgi:4'-phosphopantetheinyl transferase EntD
MMIAEILPLGVKAAEATDDAAEAYLFAAEQAALGRTIGGRRREFTTARDCARRALIDFGCPPVAIPSGENREPIWPEAFVGSITHCRGYRAAAVARRDDYLSIGIDAEPHEPLPRGILERIASPEEIEGLRALGSELCWDRILFSAKESIYKVWFPITRQWLGFEDAAVSFDPVCSTFRARLFKQATVASRDVEWLQGRFHVVNGLVLTFLGAATATEGAA